MKINARAVFLIAIIVVASIASLTLVAHMTRGDSGDHAGLIISGASLVIIAVIIIPVSILLRRMQRNIEHIMSFLSLAAAGQLDKRVELTEVLEFAGIGEQLNVMMENLEKMSRAKGDFLSRMSHEIRTPMNAIVGMASIAKHSDDIEKVRDCLHKIEENSGHLIGIINDILDFSKIESGKFELDEQLISLTHNLDFVVSMFKTRVDEKHLDLSLYLIDIKHDGIFTDSLRLNQVLINLLSNAVKFTPPGGIISVRVEERLYVNGEGVYSFSVSDTGVGIDPAHASKLFSPFVQANASVSAAFGGTGLGLVISKSIIEKMGGEIEMESEPGVGTAFFFTLRFRAQESGMTERPEAVKESEHPDYGNLRALIVDDIEINREIAAELLSDTGIMTDTAQNGSDALEKFKASPDGYYDIILMDMQMPVMDGCASTVRIRELGRDDAKRVRIVAMTANVLKEDIRRAAESGMDGHIAKPLVMRDVYDEMERLLGDKCGRSAGIGGVVEGAVYKGV
jgi:signal transduction histidine kinase/ActR/RegA family two-component response regulator